MNIDITNRETHLEQIANAQLAKLIAKSGSSFEGISLQGKSQMSDLYRHPFESFSKFLLTFLILIFCFCCLNRFAKSSAEEWPALFCGTESEITPIEEAEAG